MARLPLETVRVLDGPADVIPRQTARGTTFIYCQAGELTPIVSGSSTATFDIEVDTESTVAIICSWNVHVTEHGEDPAQMKFSVLVPGSGSQQDNFHAEITEYPDSPTASYNPSLNEVVTFDGGTLTLTIACNSVPSTATVFYHCTVILGVSTGAQCVVYSNPT